jgi:hypothetical protein
MSVTARDYTAQRTETAEIKERNTNWFKLNELGRE